MFKLDHIDHIALNVRDVEHSRRWYQEVLGLERRYQEAWNVPVVLCAGTTCLALFAASAAEPRPAADRHALGMRHLAFRVDRQNFERAQAELARWAIEFEFEDHDIAHSIYLSDPDGHLIEITTYQVQ